jgi:di/tricarboxylate transporter
MRKLTLSGLRVSNSSTRCIITGPTNVSYFFLNAFPSNVSDVASSRYLIVSVIYPLTGREKNKCEANAFSRQEIKGAEATYGTNKLLMLLLVLLH